MLVSVILLVLIIIRRLIFGGPVAGWAFTNGAVYRQNLYGNKAPPILYLKQIKMELKNSSKIFTGGTQL